MQKQRQNEIDGSIPGHIQVNIYKHYINLIN
jgi:hypothetical protein